MSSVDEATKTQIKNIEAQTGKSLEEMIAAGLATGITKHKELQAYFSNEYGLTYGNANTLTIFTRDRMKGASGEEEHFIDAQYAGKEAMRPIYDALMTAVTGFGDDVEIAPKRTYVSLRRKKQFSLVQPSTATRLDVGINLKGVEPDGRLEKSGSFNSMCTHRVRLGSAADVNDELIAWLRQAYDAA